MSVESPAAVSAEQFLAWPEEAGLLRELIDGEIRERPMTTRNPTHAMTVTRSGQTLANWPDDRADWDGVVTTGDVRCRLTRDPDTIAGIDVALFTGPHLIGDLQGLPFLDGPLSLPWRSCRQQLHTSRSATKSGGIWMPARLRSGSRTRIFRPWKSSEPAGIRSYSTLIRHRAVSRSFPDSVLLFRDCSPENTVLKLEGCLDCIPVQTPGTVS